ncbi:hypothetical protein CY35_01G113700 [Sphagnum magellanicum]|nr:hypothetical protein CY35_01G113700 [Sphagnum magellanicum]
MGAIQTDPSLLNEMFGLGVIWVHFSNLSRTSKWVWVDYRDVLGHFKENFSNKSKGNYMVEQERGRPTTCWAKMLTPQLLGV